MILTSFFKKPACFLSENVQKCRKLCKKRKVLSEVTFHINVKYAVFTITKVKLLDDTRVKDDKILFHVATSPTLTKIWVGKMLKFFRANTTALTNAQLDSIAARSS